jgi:DNA-binding LacI/PurR family transcriptional regulator
VADASGHPTLETVAEVAGVSRATVSRVINNFPKVSPQARRLVDEAIARTGYVPNRAARSLVTRRTDSIALVVPESDARFFSDPYLLGIMRAVSDELATTDLQLVLTLARSPERLERLVSYLRGGHVDGALLVSAHGTDVLENTGVLTVVGGRPLTEGSQAIYVDNDNVAGARDAVEHLVDRDRQHIATIAGPPDMCAGVDRLAGYRKALPAGQPELVAYGDFSRLSGERAMLKLLAHNPELDAVFVASDMMAEGALAALRSAGRRVPDDVAIVGFDDVDAAQYTDPPLSTVRQPLDEQGRLMTQLLLRRIEGEQVASATLPTTLVVRKSS